MDFSSICRIFTTILLWLESGKCARGSMCWGLLKLPRGRISLRVTHLNQQGLIPGLPAHLCPLLGSGLLPTRLLLGDPPLPGPCHPAQGGSVRGVTSAGAAGTAAVGLGSSPCADWEMRCRGVVGMLFWAVSCLVCAPDAPMDDRDRETHPEGNLGHVKSQF